MAVRIEFDALTGPLVQGFRKAGREADVLEKRFGKVAKESLNVREAALKLERAEVAAARALDKYKDGSLKAATAAARVERAQAALGKELRDATGYTARAAAAQARLKAAEDATASSRAKAIGSVKGMSSSLLTLTKRATLAGTALAGLGAGAAVKSAVSFEQAMGRVQAKLLISRREMAGLNKLALDLGARTQFSASEAAAAMDELAAQGFTANRIFRVLPGTLSLAAASGTDLANAASLQTETLHQFWLSADRAGKVADVLAQISNRSAADIDSMQESLKYVGPVAYSAGQTLESMGAAIGLMANAGIKGSQAGTSLRTAMVRLQAPTEPVTDSLGRMGLRARELYGPRGLLPLPEIIGKIAGASERMGRAERNAAIARIFGREALSGMQTLIDRGEGALRRETRALIESQGAARRAADIMRDNVSGAWDNFTGSVETASIRLTKRFMPSLKNALNDSAGDVDRFTATAARFVDGLTGRRSQDGFGVVNDKAQQLGLAVHDIAEDAADAAGAIRDVVFSTAQFVSKHDELSKLLGVLIAMGGAAKAIKFAGAVTGINTLMTAAGLGPAGRGAAGGALAGGAARAGQRRLTGLLAGMAMRGGASGALASGAASAVGGGGMLRFAATRALPAFLAYDVGKQAVTGSSPIRSFANTRGAYRGFDLPTTGGGFKSMMRDLEHWSLQQPEWETKARKFGDTLQRLGPRLARLDSSSLQKMAKDARQIARNFDPASKALRAFGDDVDRELGSRLRSALRTVVAGPRWTTANMFLAQVEGQWRRLPERLRGPAARSIIEAARAMERNGRLPRGATDRIISQLERRWDGLAPYLKSVGARSSRQLERTLADEKIARRVQRVVNAIGRNWGDAPRLAKVSASNSRVTWLAEMDFLREKMKTATGDQKREAKRLYDALARMNEDTAGASKRAFENAKRAYDDGVRSMLTKLDLLSPRIAALQNSATALANDPVGVMPLPAPQRKRVGGMIARFNMGGLVPALVSSGEEIVHGGRSWMVPGERTAADNVFAMLPVGAQVFTDHGQQLRAAGFSDSQALAQQMPHFAKGGTVRTGYTVYNDPPPGAFPGGLANGYAELGTAVGNTATGVGNLARQIGYRGELPVNFPITVSINGRSKKLLKRDRGFGQKGGDGKGGGGSDSRFTIDIWKDSWEFLGLNSGSRGFANVTLGGSAPGRSYGLTYTKPAPITHSRTVDLMQPYGSLDAFQQGFDAGSSGTRRLFRSWRGTDTDLFSSAVSGVRANDRDRPQRINVNVSGSSRSPRVRSTNGKTLQLPASFTPDHQTAGLAGYPATDVFASPGTTVLAPASGVVSRLSGSLSNYQGPGGPYGYSIYLKSGRGEYYMTHFGSRSVREGQRVRYGQPIGTVGDYPNATSDHIHEGLRRFGRGGRVARFRGGGRASGGVVGTQTVPKRGSIRSTGIYTPTARAHVILDAIGKQGARADDVVGSMRDLGAMLERAHFLTYSNLARLRLGIHDEIRELMKGGETGRERIQIRRLRGTLTLLEGEMGKRVGRLVSESQKALDRTDVRSNRVTQRLALSGADEGWVSSQQTLLRADRRSRRDLATQLPRLQTALSRARALRETEAVKAIREQIRTVKDSMTDLAVGIATRARDIVGTRVQEAVNRISINADLLARSVDGVEVGQRIRGVSSSSIGGMQERLGALQSQRGGVEPLIDQTWKQFIAAMRAGSIEGMRAAGDQLNALRDSIPMLDAEIAELNRSIMQTARYQPSDVRLALAQLTRDAGDDLAALREQQALYQQDLADAQARGDAEATIDLAGRLAGVQSSIEGLDQTIQDQRARDDLLADLLRETAENQRRLLAFANSQQGDGLQRLLYAALNGAIGGQVGMGAQTPLWPGNGTRY